MNSLNAKARNIVTSLLLLQFLTTLLGIPAQASETITKNKCAKIQAKIDKVHSQMRQKHTAKQSVKLKSRLSDYKDYKYQCMKKRYKTG